MERHRDHALYIAYAPAEDPKIAIGMIVENAGFGAAAAAPIARRAFDYYLLGQYPSEEDIAAVKLGKATTPIGAARSAAEFAWPPANSAAAGAPATPASAGAMPLAAVPTSQLIAAAFSPVAHATVGIPTAGTTLWVPRWRETPAYGPAAGAKPAAAKPATAAASAAKPLRVANRNAPARPAPSLKAPPAPSSGGPATPAAPAE